MTSQKNSFPTISFNIAQNLQNVRLLEVPEELLDIIVNTQQDLYFKSAPGTLTSTNGVAGKEGNVHLCANDKIWAVKQVSTSNSVYVTKVDPPEQTVHDGDPDINEDDKMSLDGHEEKSNGISKHASSISAIAKPTSILELHALPPATYEKTVHDHLSLLVPTISSPEDVFTTTPSEPIYSLKDLHNHIPAPTTTIQTIFSQKCVFEIPIPTFNPPTQASESLTQQQQLLQAYIPTPTLLLSTWTEIIDTATLTGKDITNLDAMSVPFEVSTDPDPSLDKAEQIAQLIHSSLTARLFNPTTGHLASLGIISKGDNNRYTLNTRECARWVGNLILSSGNTTTSTSTIPSLQPGETQPHLTREKFEKEWEDKVPATWIKFCSVEVLMPACEVVSVDGEEVVGWVPFVLEREGGGVSGVGKDGGSAIAAAAATGSSGAGGATKGKRKWHEKFAAQRDAKR